MNTHLKNFLLLLSVCLVYGCSISGISPGIKQQQLPDSWAATALEKSVSENWLKEFDDQRLDKLVETAMDNNYQLARQAALVEEAQQAVIISGAQRYPELSLAFDSSRRRNVINQDFTFTGTVFELGLDFGWEIDIWGKLSDAEKQASLNLLAERARYRAARYELAADVSSAWFNVISAQQLLALFRQRLENLKVDMDIIERSYRQGLSSALDVYLTRTTVEQERSRIASQEQLVNENRVALQLLLAEYPDAGIQTVDELPVIDTLIPAGLPSELVSRRPDLQQAWLQLLAADTGLALAHKQRFPSLSLVASTSDVSNRLGELLDGSSLAWSLLANLSQPLFNAGRLRAQEEQARARVRQAEKAYLDLLFQAFSEVETAISRQAALRAQYAATAAAEQNAVAGLELAFEQYQRGLVTYATVLESQRRAFDTQSAVIELRNQLLQNRITLYQALGGDFAEPAADIAGN